MSQLTAPATKSPCGCGCGGHPAPSGCGCGKTDCGGCSTGALVRPRFFAGQLLTEEDLELLTTYVMAKSRLHNRHLHGAGVVCGLEVTCHPCGGGRVTVHPGHALDCCGNDIVLPCATELDVNEMVRRLRIESLGGHDCGDPCAERPARPQPAGQDLAGRNLPGRDLPGRDAVAEPEPTGRRYCLWIEYCEEPADPVAPYVTGEPCGGQPCEASRIREGYRFQLRCPAPEEKPQNLFDRIRCCFADLAEGEKAVSDAQAYDQWGWRTAAARQQLGRIDAGEAVRFEEADLTALRESTARIEGFLARARVDDTGADVTGSPAKPLDEAFVRRGLDGLHQAARLAVKFELARASETGEEQPGVFFRDASGEERQLAEADVGRAVERVQEAAPLFQRQVTVLSASRDRVAAEAVLAQSVSFVSGETGTAPEADRVLFAYGAFTSDAYQVQAARDLRQVREWLLHRLDGARLSDCRLRREAESLRLPDERSDPAALGAAGRRLLRLVLRYLLDCVCAALNPPCPPCDDPAVLLACLEVEDCEVVEICNLERTWVLSAVALRYWLPFLHTIGEALERLCCETRRDVARPEPRPRPGSVQPLDPAPSAVGYFSASTSLYSEIRRDERFAEVLRFTGIAEDRAAATANLAGSVFSIATASSVTPALRLPDLGIAAADFAGAREARRVPSESLVEALAEPAVREAVGTVVEDRLVRAVAREEVRRPLLEEVTAAVRGEVDERLSETARTVDAKAEENASAVARLERMVKSRLTVTELQKAQPFKDLRSTGSELKKTVRDLEKANTELRERLEKLEKLEKERE